MNIHVTTVWPGLYRAVDLDTYDGALDSPTRGQVGHRTTEELAIKDLIEEIEFDREEQILTRREHLRDKHG